MTPTTVKTLAPSRRSARARRDPRRRRPRQNPSLNTITGVPAGAGSSSGVNTRPNGGRRAEHAEVVTIRERDRHHPRVGAGPEARAGDAVRAERHRRQQPPQVLVDRVRILIPEKPPAADVRALDVDAAQRARPLDTRRRGEQKRSTIVNAAKCALNPTASVAPASTKKDGMRRTARTAWRASKASAERTAARSPRCRRPAARRRLTQAEADDVLPVAPGRVQAPLRRRRGARTARRGRCRSRRAARRERGGASSGRARRRWWS